MTRHGTFFAPLLWIGIVLMPIRFRVRISILIPYRIRICILSQVYKCWQTRKFIFYFYSKSSFIYLSRQPHRCHIFSIWDSSLKVFGEKVKFSFSFGWNGCESGSEKIITIRIRIRILYEYKTLFCACPVTGPYCKIHVPGFKILIY
jgi:hypothetical protein